MPNLLNDDIRGQVKDLFDAQLKQPVEVLFFGSSIKENCEYCEETHQLLEEVISISEKLHLNVYDIDQDSSTAQAYHVDKTPTTVIAAKNDGDLSGKDALTDFGIRYAGIPSGHEFSSLIHSIVLASGRDSGLKPETRQLLSKLITRQQYA